MSCVTARRKGHRRVAANSNLNANIRLPVSYWALHRCSLPSGGPFQKPIRCLLSFCDLPLTRFVYYWTGRVWISVRIRTAAIIRPTQTCHRGHRSVLLHWIHHGGQYLTSLQGLHHFYLFSAVDTNGKCTGQLCRLIWITLNHRQSCKCHMQATYWLNRPSISHWSISKRKITQMGGVGGRWHSPVDANWLGEQKNLLVSGQSMAVVICRQSKVFSLKKPLASQAHRQKLTRNKHLIKRQINIGSRNIPAPRTVFSWFIGCRKTKTKNKRITARTNLRPIDMKTVQRTSTAPGRIVFFERQVPFRL